VSAGSTYLKQYLNIFFSERNNLCAYLNCGQQLTDIKKMLEQLKPELTERFYVQSIGLFGSIVRDDFSSNSDIDIIVDFDRPVGVEFIDLADYAAKTYSYSSTNGIIFLFVLEKIIYEKGRSHCQLMAERDGFYTQNKGSWRSST
jgi:hypothetical protein